MSSLDSGGYSSGEKRYGRRVYQVFQLFNVVSFTMLSGSVLTLLALRLGAGSFVIGLISSMAYVSLLLMIPGRRLIRVLGTKRQLGLSWGLRNLSMVPVVFAPSAAASGNYVGAMLLIVVPFLGFNVFKGTGLVGVNPLLGALSEGKDRGSFLSKLQINIHAMLIITNLVIAFFLGVDAALARYIILIIAGILAGLLSTVFIYRIPEPPTDETSAAEKLFAGFRGALRRSDFRGFIALTFVIALFTGLANPFVIVYAKRIYNQPDNIVVLFLVVGNIGAISMGLIARALIDRLGAKPLYVIFLAILCASVVPIIVSPSFGPVGTLVFLIALFFFYNFGLVGGANTAQNYFFAITDATQHLNLGILYNVVGGVAGTVGALAGGGLLVALESGFAVDVNAFRVFYAVALGLLLVSFPLVLRLRNVGRFSVRNVLEIFLSRRDLKAVALLHKLDTTRTVGEEIKVIDSLADLESSVPLEDLIAKLKSPRYYVRAHALRALQNLPLDAAVTRALIAQVRNNPFTTAHIAARILGLKRAREGLRVLRKAVDSPDYLLQGESMLALARLGDRDSIDAVERTLVESENPLVQIYAASALEMLESVSSIPALLTALRKPDPPPYLRDEIILSIAGILGMGDWFHEMYSDFLDKATRGLSALLSYARDCGLDAKTTDRLSGTLRAVNRDRTRFGEEIVRWLDRPVGEGTGDLTHLQEAAADPELLRFDRLAFLLAAVVVRVLCRGGKAPGAR